ncbi:MAG: beta-galactosidase [Actinomycetota bacterium]|jgi:beta-galactosidase|nr:beta-galactosidase [Actinomycetota bacterium]
MAFEHLPLRDDGSPAIGFGGDYYPEQWDRAVWKEDVALMTEAGVNLVSVGIFSWALLEPAEGVYEFGWLDDALDLLHEGGIRVDLANASASPPPWFSHKYPQSLPVRIDGVRLGYGSRQAFCSSSADYRRASAALTTKIVERYAAHPAVVMWHVHNEYGCHNDPCYCDASQASFQSWLRAKYGTIEAVNEAWGTAFWSQHYYSFDEITPPRATGTFINPTQRLDYSRFSSDDLLECFEAEAAIIRAHSPLPVTTNFMGLTMGLDRPIDYWKWADRMDVVSNDHYLIADDARNFQELAMTSDYIRGLADGAPWLLMEHSSSAVNWQPRNIAKKPGEMIRNSLQHVARGADAALFFQWRAARAGSEKFHSALLPHAGRDSTLFRDVVKLGAYLGKLGEVVGSRVVGADIVIINDTDARWASELDAHPSIDVTTVPETRLWHDALYRGGYTTDFRRATDDLSGYRVAIVPVQYLMTDAGAANLRGFVESGGTLVATYFSGIVNENDHIRLGGYPGALSEVLGIRIEEFFPLLQSETIALSEFGAGSKWSERGTVSSARVLAEYASGPVQGSAAVTRNAFGKGSAYYVGTSLTTGGVSALFAQVAAEASITPFVSVPQDVEVVLRSNAGTSWAFVINHTSEDVALSLDGVDLLAGSPTGGSLTVDAGGVAVVRLSTPIGDS